MAARKTRPEASPVLEFKSASLTVPLLSLLSNDVSEIARQLGQKVARSPSFFRDSPLLIDLQQLSRQSLDLPVDLLIMMVREQGFMPVGIRGGSEQQHEDALMLNVPVLPLPAQRQAAEEDSASAAGEAAAPASAGEEAGRRSAPRGEAEPSEPQAPPLENKLITQPIRSGQRVYARGDLTVTATVSAGAEIMAEGNIHVYGSLRGRALAGVRGNESSRIFCMDLQAELLSIAGIYQLRDDTQAPPRRPVTVSLEQQALVIKEIA